MTGDNESSVRRIFELPACVFCGSGDVSKEHLLAAWVFRSVQRTRRPRINVMRRSLNTGDIDHRYGEAQDAAAVACTTCNNGWMSRLDEAAALVLKPLVRGEGPVVLAPAQQRDVATWAVKTIIVNDLPITGGASRLAEFAPALRETNIPLSFMEVWVGPPGAPALAGGMRVLGVVPHDGQLVLGTGPDRQEHALNSWKLMLGYVDLLLRPTLRWVPLPDPDGYTRIWPADDRDVTVVPEIRTP
jgi:hypothetical protein